MRMQLMLVRAMTPVNGPDGTGFPARTATPAQPPGASSLLIRAAPTASPG